MLQARQSLSFMQGPVKAQFLTTQRVGAPGLPSLLAQGAKAIPLSQFPCRPAYAEQLARLVSSPVRLCSTISHAQVYPHLLLCMPFPQAGSHAQVLPLQPRMAPSRELFPQTHSRLSDNHLSSHALFCSRETRRTLVRPDPAVFFHVQSTRTSRQHVTSSEPNQPPSSDCPASSLAQRLVYLLHARMDAPTEDRSFLHANNGPAGPLLLHGYQRSLSLQTRLQQISRSLSHVLELVIAFLCAPGEFEPAASSTCPLAPCIRLVLLAITISPLACKP